jgi:hypothetical protein
LVVAAVATIAENGLGVARVVAGVGNEFHAAIAVALAGVASVAVTELAVPVIGPRGSASSAEFVIGVLVWVFLSIVLGNLDEVRDRVDCPVEPFDLGDQGLIFASVLEAVDCGIGVDVGCVHP